MIQVDARSSTLTLDGVVHDCAVGREGAIAPDAKREGDGCTPLGTWRMHGAILRPDRGYVPPATMPWRWCRPTDGWCDDPADPAYNRPICRPFDGSAERLWRDDKQYDVVIVLGYNDRPVHPGVGSAIFLHLMGDGPTAGCVAVEPATMRIILCSDTDMIAISYPGSDW